MPLGGCTTVLVSEPSTSPYRSSGKIPLQPKPLIYLVGHALFNIVIPVSKLSEIHKTDWQDMSGTGRAEDCTTVRDFNQLT